MHDVYSCAPRLSYLGWEPHEFYIVGPLFRTARAAPSAASIADHDMLAVGLKTKLLTR